MDEALEMVIANENTNKVPRPGHATHVLGN
jgi:hypothetical protein